MIQPVNASTLKIYFCKREENFLFRVSVTDICIRTELQQENAGGVTNFKDKRVERTKIFTHPCLIDFVLSMGSVEAQILQTSQ